MRRRTPYKTNQFRRYRLNYSIVSPTIRLLDEKGKQIAIVSKIEALQKAKELNVDVVEIAPNANPPVAKLIDFKKFKYQESKKQREEKRKQKNVEIKEVRIRPFTDEHDFNTRADKAKEFLQDGNLLKITVFFKGREIIRKQYGYDAMSRFIKKLEPVKIIREAHMEGRSLSSTVMKDSIK